MEDCLHVQESSSETSSADPFFEDWIRAMEWARSVARRHAGEQEQEEQEEAHSLQEEEARLGEWSWRYVV
eukprot:3709264-Rhodomonas_salina.1